MDKASYKKNKTGNIKKEVTYLVQQIWGCLADATPLKRYEYYAMEERTHPPFSTYWKEKEVKLFKDNIKSEFGIRLEITKRDKFNDIIRKIRILTEISK